MEIRPDGARNARHQVDARDVRKLVDTELMIGVIQTGHTVEPEDLPYLPEVFKQLRNEASSINRILDADESVK